LVSLHLHGPPGLSVAGKAGAAGHCPPMRQFGAALLAQLWLREVNDVRNCARL
jgi:hypothetical protein